jgi:hypothetical protein
MSVYPNIFAGGATMVAGTETVVATSAFMSTAPVGGQGNMIAGLLSFVANATPGTVTVRVRQNTLTGTIVFSSGLQTITTASVASSLTIFTQDVSAATAGVAQYVVTANFSNLPTATAFTGYVQEGEDTD